MYSVYQHWDPLRVCVVGRSYPPEFYSWITVPRVRTLFERMAIETEEDYQAIIKKLEEFGVTVLRPNLSQHTLIGGKYLPPPMCPRDFMIMLGQDFYEIATLDFKQFYYDVKDPSWPPCETWQEFLSLPKAIQDECNNVHHLSEYRDFYSSYDHIFDHIAQQGHLIQSARDFSKGPGGMITRVGRDIYFGTDSYDQDQTAYLAHLNQKFKHTRNHVVNTGGHSDGTYCPVCPGLIISTKDVPTYATTFPGWEVVYLPNMVDYYIDRKNLHRVKPFLKLKHRNGGRWWIPGWEHDQAVTDVVETALTHWTGYVEETVFDVNMLVIDPKNVIVYNYNKVVFDALDRYGITAHVIPFRHKLFWDAGIHCLTADLDRDGVPQDYFPERG